eukprot:scaffold67383_cov25-Tisochrysis_lutea.AAC.1
MAVVESSFCVRTMLVSRSIRSLVSASLFLSYARSRQFLASCSGNHCSHRRAMISHKRRRSSWNEAASRRRSVSLASRAARSSRPTSSWRERARKASFSALDLDPDASRIEAEADERPLAAICRTRE